MDKAIAEGKPFYLNMAHYALHAPFMADKRFLSHYEGDASKSDAAKAFATLVEGMDKSLGEIMDYLVEKGVAENTLIIFLGDNGGDAPLGPAREYASPLLYGERKVRSPKVECECHSSFRGQNQMQKTNCKKLSRLLPVKYKLRWER